MFQSLEIGDDINDSIVLPYRTGRRVCWDLSIKETIVTDVFIYTEVKTLLHDSGTPPAHPTSISWEEHNLESFCL